MLWVDAICINQHVIPEKNDQVAIMRRIYLGAENVVVWLGEEESAAIALRFCSMIQNGISMSKLGDEIESQGLTFDLVWAYCSLLFTRPWFSRTWILQEIIHSRPATVHIGTIQIDIDDLCAKYDGYQKYEQVHRSTQMSAVEELGIYSDAFKIEAMINMVDIIGWRREQASGDESIISMMSALHMSQFQQCRDPRDRIYGLSGIIGDIQISIDYSLSKSELYTATMKQMLSRYKESLLLIQSSERQISSSHLPSWVADWTTPHSLFSSIMSFWANNVFSSSGEMEVEDSEVPFLDSAFHIDGSLLVVQGIHVGTITRTCFVKNTFGTGKSQENTMKLFSYEQRRGGQLSRGRQEGSQEQTPQDMTMRNSSWGPHWAEIGDIIIISRLCWAPLVLRRERETYLFVGACWLVDSELQGSDSRQMSGIEALGKDPGFSPIMHGGAWDEDQLEEFKIG